MKLNNLYLGWRIDAAGLGACLVVSIAAYLFGVVPLMRQSAAAHDLAQQLEHQKQTASDTLKSHHTLKQRLEHAQEALNEAPFRLRPISHLNQYLAQITNLATKSGLTLHEIQPGQPASLRYYRAIPIRLSGTGTYRVCALFLHQLNKKFPDTRVSSMKLLAASHPTNPEAQITVDLAWHAAPAKKTDPE